jgi:hypothetical protein
MSETVDIATHELVGPRKFAPCFMHILEKCAREHLALHVIVAAKGVRISSGHSSYKDSAVGLILQGRWRSHLLEPEAVHKHLKILLPFVFLVDRITFPRVCLTSTNRHDRSIADFFMRNIFLLLFQRRQYTCVAIPSNGDARALNRVNTDLMKAYTWMLRGYFTDEALRRPNCSDLVLANTHVKALTHSSHLLEREAAGVRASIAATLDIRDPLEVMVNRFRTLRSQCQALY